jgi:hypothetical protein
MRFLFAALLFVLAACASAPAPAGPRLEGSYQLVQVNGHALPTPSPGDSTTMIEAVTLVLGPDGRYTMRVAGHDPASGTDARAEVNGAYRVEADRLALYPDEGTEADPTEYRWTLEGGRLRLIDEMDDEYVFARQ